MRRKLDPRENTNGGVNNFMGRIKGMHIFVGKFTYVLDFMIIEDISSIIDPRLSQVVLRKPFVEISNMTHDPPKGVVRFTNGTDEIAYKMPHKIEQYNSLLDLKIEHTKLVYLRNEEDKIRGVEYVMSKILGFYKECLELGPEYATGIADEGEVTQEKKKKEIGKSHLLEDKQIPSVGVFDEVFITWMTFGGNTCDLDSFREETDETTALHQVSLRTTHKERGDGIASIKRRRRDFQSDDVKDFVTASEHSRLKEDLESST
ncbi:hypothetical protein Tco_0933926 [Tanacetum coccineum]